MMQPYVNPYLFSNPYYLNGLNNTMQNTQNNFNQQTGFSGRYVNEFSEISASDIPMNGPALFPKNDRSEIQLREWSPNGQIVTTSYKAIVDDNKGQGLNSMTDNIEVKFDAKSEVLEPIFERLSEIESKLDKLTKPVSKTTKGATAE